MIMATFRSIGFSTFLLALKCLFLLSVKNQPKDDKPQTNTNNTNSRMNKTNSTSASNMSAQAAAAAAAAPAAAAASQSAKLSNLSASDEQLELDQFAGAVLQEICDHDWIKERCFHEGDNLLRANQLLEPALGRKPQNLLHIICYPPTHELRRQQNEQSSTKDFIIKLLQKLDIWTLRETLIEFKLLVELEKSTNQKDHRLTEYTVECLAKTTIDYLIDADKPQPSQIATSLAANQHQLQRSLSNMDANVSSAPPRSIESEPPASMQNPNSVDSGGDHPPPPPPSHHASAAAANSIISPQSNAPLGAGNQDSTGDVAGMDVDDLPPGSVAATAASNPAHVVPGSIDDDIGENILAETDLNQHIEIDGMLGSSASTTGLATNNANNGNGTTSNANNNVNGDGGSLITDDFSPWESIIEAATSSSSSSSSAATGTLSSSHALAAALTTSTAACCSTSAGVWLIAPLITRLPDQCQVKIIEQASRQLQDLGKAFWNAKNKSDKETLAIKNIFVWNQQPFFSLLLACLKRQSEQQRHLLTSLFYGLTDFIQNKEDKILSEDPRIKQIMMDTLHLRLSLVGSMFDFILKNQNDYINWVWLFVQLINSGVVDPDNDQLVFTMIVDMFAVLIHTIVSLEPNLDNNKLFQAIVKKIYKETKDLSDAPNSRAINYIRRLLPLNKSSLLDVLTVESYSTTASKSHTSLQDKRRGFKFARKERISQWELIEGVKNASSVCLSWYGASKLERRSLLRYDYQQRLLVRHKHATVHKDMAYFKERPISKHDLLPNDLIDIPEITVESEQPPPATPAPAATPAAAAGVKHDESPIQIIGASSSSASATAANNSDCMIIGHTGPTPPMSAAAAGHHVGSAPHPHPHHPNMIIPPPPQSALIGGPHGPHPHPAGHHGPPNNPAALQQPGVGAASQPPTSAHSQILSRLSSQLQQQQMPPQHPHMMQQQMPPNMMGVEQQQQQQPAAQQRKGASRQQSTSSTPDKQTKANGGGSTTKKQRNTSTTPKRKNAAAASAASVVPPLGLPGQVAPGQMPPQGMNPAAAMQQAKMGQAQSAPIMQHPGQQQPGGGPFSANQPGMHPGMPQQVPPGSYAGGPGQQIAPGGGPRMINPNAQQQQAAQQQQRNVNMPYQQQPGQQGGGPQFYAQQGQPQQPGQSITPQPPNQFIPQPGQPQQQQQRGPQAAGAAGNRPLSFQGANMAPNQQPPQPPQQQPAQQRKSTGGASAAAIQPATQKPGLAPAGYPNQPQQQPGNIQAQQQPNRMLTSTPMPPQQQQQQMYAAQQNAQIYPKQPNMQPGLQQQQQRTGTPDLMQQQQQPPQGGGMMGIKQPQQQQPQAQQQYNNPNAGFIPQQQQQQPQARIQMPPQQQQQQAAAARMQFQQQQQQPQNPQQQQPGTNMMNPNLNWQQQQQRQQQMAMQQQQQRPQQQQFGQQAQQQQFMAQQQQQKPGQFIPNQPQQGQRMIQPQQQQQQQYPF